MNNSKDVNKRCLFISTEFPPGPGGIGAHAYNIINILREENNWEIRILTNQDYASESEIQTFNASYPSKVLRLFDAPTKIKLIKKIRTIVAAYKAYKPDLIIASGKHAVWFGAFLKVIFKKPFITFSHGSEFGTTDPKEIKYNLKSYQKADLNISVSKYTDEYIKRKTKINFKKSIVVHNGADPNVFYQINEKEKAIFKEEKGLFDKNIIVTLGNVSERKGQWVVINALPKVVKEFPDTHYYCIGLKTEANKFMKIAKELSVEQNVHFLGKIDQNELKLWLNAADLFAMTSTHTKSGKFEGFGISVIEAALCGTPAIVSNGKSGVCESIINGQTGLLVKEKDEQDTAHKIIEYFKEDDILRKHLENQCVINAQNNHTWSGVVKTMVEHILKV